MIKFIYTPNNGIMKLINTSIADYGNSYLYRILEDGCELKLNNLQIFLVCEPVDSNGTHYYRNPLAVVAINDYDAVRVYFEETQQPGSVMCTLEKVASKAKVKSVDSIDI